MAIASQAALQRPAGHRNNLAGDAGDGWRGKVDYGTGVSSRLVQQSSPVLGTLVRLARSAILSVLPLGSALQTSRPALLAGAKPSQLSWYPSELASEESSGAQGRYSLFGFRSGRGGLFRPGPAPTKQEVSRNT